MGSPCKKWAVAVGLTVPWAAGHVNFAGALGGLLHPLTKKRVCAWWSSSPGWVWLQDTGPHPPGAWGPARPPSSGVGPVLL